jgi:D-3-phosphoglycerate dehydrogenase / 2-oxoglutarate reductase
MTGGVPRILVAERSSFSERGLQAFARLGQVDALDLTQDDLRALIGNYEVLVLRLGLQVDQSVIADGESLRAIATATTGLDHIDLSAAGQHKVAVLSLRGERAFLDQVYATAEHTFALLLSLVRQIPSAFKAAKDYEWRRDLFRGTELNGKSLGIIGCGRLGRMVARYGAAFGMRVLVFDPYQTDIPDGVERCESLHQLLENSDIVSLHVPLNAETRNLISTVEFAAMRPGTILVNTARGAVVDEQALLNVLESGRLGGAALDVLAQEHTLKARRDHPLIEYAWAHENLIITPHIAGATQESVEKADIFLAGKLQEFLSTNQTLKRTYA